MFVFVGSRIDVRKGYFFFFFLVSEFVFFKQVRVQNCLFYREMSPVCGWS